jgi:glycosyltransferase involved in cell wall biosynthesis
MDERDVSSGRPVLSVVIASVNGYRYIAQCLHSLMGQRGAERAEIIVVEASEDDTARLIGAEYPGVTLIPVSDGRSIPALRAIGIRKAKGDIVATTKDHCVLDQAGMIGSSRPTARCLTPPSVGCRKRQSRRLVDWAAYICEYGKFMLPFEARPESIFPDPTSPTGARFGTGLR